MPDDWLSEDELDQIFAHWMGEIIQPRSVELETPGMLRTLAEIQGLPEAAQPSC